MKKYFFALLVLLVVVGVVRDINKSRKISSLEGRIQSLEMFKEGQDLKAKNLEKRDSSLAGDLNLIDERLGHYKTRLEDQEAFSAINRKAAQQNYKKDRVLLNKINAIEEQVFPTDPVKFLPGEVDSLSTWWFFSNQ